MKVIRFIFLSTGLLGLFLTMLSCSTTKVAEEKDPYLWLEEVEGQRALQWVQKQNQNTLKIVQDDANFKSINKTALALLEDKSKIPYGIPKGKFLYNFWQDKDHVRGVWRRTSLNSYKNKKVSWETVLDIDALAKQEKENWVYKGSDCLPPKFQKCLVTLSRGGKDASVVREYDVLKKSFVSNGFAIPEAKSRMAWIDEDHVFVGTNFGEKSLTESGYPRILKIWRRGTALKEAKTLFEGDYKDLMVAGNTWFREGGNISYVTKVLNFYEAKNYIFHKGKLVEVGVPSSAEIEMEFKGHILFKLRKDWNLGSKKLLAGSLVSVAMKNILNKNIGDSSVRLVFQPNNTTAIRFAARTKNDILISVLENVRGKVYSTRLEGAEWQKLKELPLKQSGHVNLLYSSPLSEKIYYVFQDFLTPESYLYFDLRSMKNHALKSLDKKFVSQGMDVQQKWATSADGTKIPYFLVGKKEVLEKPSGKAPTLLYGYGGFEISRTPKYSATTGRIWLENGGVYVVANIRGGGEFGPRWHQAALKMNRQRAFDDFIAVAEDLQKTKITSADHLAIMGGSNGGLLVGTVMTQRPDLFKAVVCLVPLLDMIRYTKLLAGASWMAEYGDPEDSKMRQYILGYSPYQNISPTKKYPHLFMMTSTKDDRVHPGHARKMVAKMQSMGHKKIRYFENTEGGHAASSNLKQRARMQAMYYSFLLKTLK